MTQGQAYPVIRKDLGMKFLPKKECRLFREKAAPKNFYYLISYVFEIIMHGKSIPKISGESSVSVMLPFPARSPLRAMTGKFLNIP
ncbi:hypothetical protein [Gluconacetobacter entanii]|uniref:Uncharacterized protein n=1 Tax=Gluconacetobacter entanii TaxID=108528 RepID=A0A318PYK8_9PROT|nr:hypothetical protein [Gluconacetobacter entanii]MCE2578262.1 hypothetical protein [Komagataeibacter sp. FNDCR1]PYD63572.1 hypothetical protein CFR72_06620 [Gluconacetobacter entanii]